MRQISSSSTIIYKLGLAAVFYLLIVTSYVVILIAAFFTGDFRFVALFTPIYILFFFAVRMIQKQFVSHLADKVIDYCDRLEITKDGQTHVVRLADCNRVNYDGYTKPPRVTVWFSPSKKLGTNVSFIPSLRWNFWVYYAPAIVDELRTRIDCARKE